MLKLPDYIQFQYTIVSTAHITVTVPRSEIFKTKKKIKIKKKRPKEVVGHILFIMMNRIMENWNNDKNALDNEEWTAYTRRSLEGEQNS